MCDDRTELQAFPNSSILGEKVVPVKQHVLEAAELDVGSDEDSGLRNIRFWSPVNFWVLGEVQAVVNAYEYV